MIFFRPPTTVGTLEALGVVYRAVRAWRFYPKGHPTRRSSLNLAYEAMLRLLDGNTLLLACGRSGFSFPDGESIKDATGHSAALAFELFVRRAQKITFSHDLFQEDLLEFFQIMSLTPEAISRSGGFDAIMAERGIRSIWVNEFDLTAIRSKRKKVENSGIVPQGIDDAEMGGDVASVYEQALPDTDPLTAEQQLRLLLVRLASCTDDDTYLILTRRVVACIDSVQAGIDLNLFFQLIELLVRHAGDELCSRSVQECAQFAIEQIIIHDNALQLILEQAGRDNKISKKTLLAILKSGGAAAIKSAIEMMGRTGDLKTRKALSTTMGNIGEAAVPALLNLMQDSRWFITRNICAILGVIASCDALVPLTKCLQHTDLRVRKEAIRSLAQIGGHEAEAALLDVLRGADTALYPQSIASLGGMKSRKSLVELIKIVCARDMFLKSLSLKIDALSAIALIGDRQVTPIMITLIEERHLLAVLRARQLKIAVADCLGRIGDVRALPVLEKLASGGGELGVACLEAIAMIERTEGMPDGIS